MRLIVRLKNRRGQTQHRANQREAAKRTLAALLIHDRIEHHDEHAEKGQNNFGQDRDVVRALRQGFNNGLERHH